MTSNDEHHQNVTVEKPSKIERVEKSTKKAGKSSVVMPRVVRIYMTDNDATDSSSDEEEMLQGEKSQRPKKLWIKEIMIENGRTRVISKNKSKEKKLLQFISVLEYMKGNSNPSRRRVRLAVMGLRMGKVRTKEKFSVEAKSKTTVKPKEKPAAKPNLNAKANPKAAPGDEGFHKEGKEVEAQESRICM
ncbi:hypothetical protein CQW23_01630 [Capsicum baccatum]|uniref:Uncharacterized protein n=1 Tax=Capsicum baccatum TaxID=33114 RepID=A0A2G2XP55_CAPBA|nr:hypothetical protein CQW23_01630 [Capsicum baccatum]